MTVHRYLVQHIEIVETSQQTIQRLLIGKVDFDFQAQLPIS